MNTQKSLYLRWLWWKHTWTFQAAHKPLCGRFHQDVLRLGPLRLCRSCAAMYGAFALTLAVAAITGVRAVVFPGAVILASTLAVAILSAPRLYHHSPRLARDLLRSASGFLAAQGLALLATSSWLYGTGTLTQLLSAWFIYHRMERETRCEEDLCAGCAEYGGDGVCSGYRYQAACLRAYEDGATTWLERQPGADFRAR